ncbi:MAG: riboflavin synthase [Halobacteriovoraceae bacterium]|nr:riboflavin synthase [Halobacteriovoraceae bacterium]
MFTGLVKEIGKIKSISRTTEGLDIEVTSHSLVKDIAIDDSVSISGVCQTVVSFNSNSFKVQAVSTTLDKTNFKNLKVGSPVNLELALTLSERMGGHLVQGHVNGVGKIINWENKGKNYVVTFGIPKELMRYVVKEGSITLNGISLTISDINPQKNIAQVSVIPHTWNNTLFKYSAIGDEINIEVDIIAKYVENLLFHGGKQSNIVEKEESKINENWLKSQGFWD